MNPSMTLTVMVLFVLLPIWVVAGLADWLCHRLNDLPGTTGPKESLLHLLLLVEMGVLLLAVLLFEFRAIVLLVALLTFLLHEATTIWDLSYASARRRIPPLEQHIHSVLEMLPLAIILVGAALYPEAVLALADRTDQPGQFDLVLKEQPLPAFYVTTGLGVAGILAFLPYLEELWRAYRHRLLQNRALQANRAFLLHQ
ncbi:hypothetical protein [Chitinimonas lacunae]|uniref:Diguanylate cyclase n=1 Tax=Chitinimonas lacunae TaxID=1963018 RepID=A0ABV8MKM3_9NEIS